MKRNLLAILCVSLLSVGFVFAQENHGRMEAKYLFSYGPPGSSIELSQPQQIRSDGSSGEIYICDTGHSRIVILDSKGLFLFEFSNSEVLRSPRDVAVDSEGKIYVLGSAVPESPIIVFDYNGEYLHPLRFQGGPDLSSMAMASMVMDGANRLFILDENGARILSYDWLGDFVSEITLMPESSAEERDRQVWGKLALAGEDILLPAPMDGTVYCYGRDGILKKAFGHRGDGYGEFSFPIAATLDAQQNIYALDKHKGLIISFSQTGKVREEIGRYGLGPGYFYHPIALLADDDGRVWVAQGYKDLVQVFQLSAPAEVAPLAPQEPVVVDN
ncbi:MAG TPA: NHL repeat-containing protein [bacterium]|jgi:hypothetical protein